VKFFGEDIFPTFNFVFSITVYVPVTWGYMGLHMHFYTIVHYKAFTCCVRTAGFNLIKLYNSASLTCGTRPYPRELFIEY
jgi:hypothetical protein